VGKDLTPYQQRIVRGWYRNLDALRAQRLQEIAGDIFLADSERKRERLWQRARELLEKDAAAHPAEVRAVLERRDVEGLARLVRGE